MAATEKLPDLPDPANLDTIQPWIIKVIGVYKTEAMKAQIKSDCLDAYRKAGVIL